VAIVFAILLNEIASKGGKKVVQTISYLPHFLSWIIVTGILHDNCISNPAFKTLPTFIRRRIIIVGLIPGSVTYLIFAQSSYECR